MVNYPADWEVKKLGECGKFISGNGFPLKYQGKIKGVYPFYKVSDLNNEGNEIYMFNANNYISCEVAKKLSCNMIPSDSIIFAKIGAAIFLERKRITTCICCIDNNMMSFQPFENISGKFIYYLMQRLKFGDYVQTTALPSLSSKNLTDIIIPLLPLSEQHAIANTLAVFDNHINNLSELIAKKKAIRDGALNDLMTGWTRLKGFCSAWEVKKLGEIGYTYSGLTGKTKSDFETGSGKFITFLNVLNNITIDINILGRVNIRENERQNAVKMGDLFFNTSSETPGEVGMCATLLENPGICYLNSFCMGYRLKYDDISPLFLSYYFNSCAGRALMRKHAQGSTRYNLSKKNFLQENISLPPLTEQQAIADTLTAFDNEILALESERDKIIQIRDGAMNDLLTGKVRLC